MIFSNPTLTGKQINDNNHICDNRLKSNEIVVIDQGIKDYPILIDSLRADLIVHILDSKHDGVIQLTSILHQYTNLKAVHILAHGQEGYLSLGNSILSNETITQYQNAFFSWRLALSDSADILVYGCEVAKGVAGETFIQQLAAHTNANIAASRNLTGNRKLDGDWELGYLVGSVSARLPFNSNITDSYPFVLTLESFTGFVHDTHRAPSFAFNGFTYSINDPSPVSSDLREMVFGGDPYLELGGGIGTTIFSITKTNGSEFSLTSLTIRDEFNIGDTYSVSGWRDGAKVTADYNHTLTGTNSNTNSFSGTSDIGFQNIDAIKFSGTDIGFSLEDWTFGAAITGPTITSATYDATTNTLVVTGTNMVATAGALNDINVSKLTLTGQGGATYTLTTSNVEITSATSFTVALNATDRVNVEGLLNKNGTSATDATTFNIAAADDWNPSQAGNADLTSNAVTVSNLQTPTITSATYDANTGSLVVTGTNLVKVSGATNDITANKLTLTGEGGTTYTLTDSSNVEITSETAFIITLSVTDKAAINQILNRNGTTSTTTTTYNLAAADDWNTVIGNMDISDATGNGIAVNNVAAPAITSAAYDYSTNTLVVTGTGFLKKSGASNDIDISKFTFTGEGAATYTLTSTSDVEIDSATQFTINLSNNDTFNVAALLNNNGTTSSVSGTFYNLGAAEDWAAGADAAVNVADTTGNGITVSNYTTPTVTSATYDVGTGQLTITGTNFVNKSGATNDLDASLLTFTGEGGSYTLTDTSDVDIASASAATLILSAADQLHIHGLLNKNGTSSGSATTYNLAFADNWLAGAPSAIDIADLTGNGITVSNVLTPTIISATYDSNTGTLVVTGANLFKKTGASNDIDVSMLTFTGGVANSTYTLTSATDAEITSATSFTTTLSGADKTSVETLLDQTGTTSSSGSIYNLAAADNWLTAADIATNIADTTAAITASANPKISSATYNANTGNLIVTGIDIQANGGSSDIDVSMLTLTGEGDVSYTLTDSTDVERDSATQFTVTLSATDKAAINQIINKDGISSTGGATYNLAAADDWNTNAVAGNTSDMTGNSITASNVAAPAITSATYDANTGVLVVTGTGFLKTSGAANDIDVSKFTLTGEGSDTYTLTDATDIEITSGTAFTITLNSTDKAVVNQIINKDGISSTGGTTYNLAAAEDWATGADAAVNVVDATNGITVNNVAAPTITSATYNTNTGVLVVTGTNFLKSSGAANDIVANKFTFTGEGGATYTLTATADVEISSASIFTLNLNAADKAAINLLINKNGTASNDATTYNLAADEDWATGADVAVNVADMTGNGIIATIPATSSGGGGTPSTPTPTTPTTPAIKVTTKVIDGVTVNIQSEADNSVTLIVPVIESTRTEDQETLSDMHADIPVLINATEEPTLTVSLPTSVGLAVNGQSEPMRTQDALAELIRRIEQKTVIGSDEQLEMTMQGRNFIALLSENDFVSIQTITPVVDNDQIPDLPIIITGPNISGDGKQALIIDATNLPSGTVIQLDNVAFAAIIGAVGVAGGTGKNFVMGNEASQFIILGADDDILFGGGGDDTIGSLGGDDQTSGDAGKDNIFGGAGHDILTGGTGDDALNGGLGFDTAVQTGQLSDYQIRLSENRITLTSNSGEKDTLTDIELVQFEQGDSLAIAHSVAEAAAHHLVKTWLGRDLTSAEGNAVQSWVGADANNIVNAFLHLPEAVDLREKTAEELLASLDENPNIIQMDIMRNLTGGSGNDRGYLHLGLALNVDGGGGHDVLQMTGNRTDVHIEQINDTFEVTRLQDGAMLSLKNAEMIAFDSGENVLLPHNQTESILGRLFQTFFNRDATINEWQLGREAIASKINPNIILDWFQNNANLSDLNDADYIQTLYNHALERQATESESAHYQSQLESGGISREWLAVDIANSEEAISPTGSVLLLEGGM